MCKACAIRIVDEAIEEGVVRYEARDSTIWFVENAPEHAAKVLAERRYEEQSQRQYIGEMLGVLPEDVL